MFSSIQIIAITVIKYFKEEYMLLLPVSLLPIKILTILLDCHE